MQFATESWNGGAIVKMKELVEYLGLWLGETPTYQMKEPEPQCGDYLCGRQRRAARSGPGRDLSAKFQYIQGDI